MAVCDVNETEGKETVDEIRRSGGNARFYLLDVSSEPQVRTVFSKIGEELGDMYGLVNSV